MSRLTGSDALGLYEAYQAVYAPQELTEEQVWEEVETWVNSLLEEGYDLSDYTWEEMYESYLEEKEGIFNNDITRGISRAASGIGDYAKSLTNAQKGGRGASGRPMSNLGPNYADQERKLSQAANRSQIGTPRQGTAGGNSGLGNISPSEGTGRGGPSDIRKTQSRTNIPPIKPAASAAAPKPAASAAAPKPAPAGQTGDKTKDMATFAKANPALAAAAAERARTRGTSQSDNPLMKGMPGKRPMTPSVQSPTLAKDLGKGSGNQSLLNNPNASKAAPPKATPTPTAAPKPATTPAAGNTLSQTAAGVSKPTTFSPTPAAKPTLKKPIVSGFDMFDVVKGYLIGEGYADTEEAALAIMTNMSEEWKQSIIEERAPGVKPYTPNRLNPLPKEKPLSGKKGDGSGYGADEKFKKPDDKIEKPGTEVPAPKKGGYGRIFSNIPYGIGAHANRNRSRNSTIRGMDPGAPRSEKLAPTEKKKPSKEIVRKRKDTNESYNIILSYLLDEGYANSVEAAESIMVSMSEDWVLSIIQ